MEEGLSATINIEVSEEDGRYDYTISCDRELPLDEVRGILAGALSLTILGEPNPHLQGEALKDVLDFLQQEFVSTDDSDIKITRRK
jgi:hypothetical protein